MSKYYYNIEEHLALGIVQANRVLQHIQHQSDRIEELEAELNLMKTSGIVEVSVRNQSVMEYMKHWEGRAEAAEAKLAEAVAHLEWFISEDETNRGDDPMPERRNRTWDEINAYWIKHLDSAIAFVAEVKGDKV